MSKEPNKSKEPNNEEAKVLSDEELEGIVGGGKPIDLPSTQDQIRGALS